MNSEEKRHFKKATDKIRRVKIFYIHLAGYIVAVALLVYNLYIVEGEYKNNIIALNLSVLLAWTVFIIIHGLNVFKSHSIFKKSWEDKKIEQFLKEKEEEKATWE